SGLVSARPAHCQRSRGGHLSRLACRVAADFRNTATRGDCVSEPAEIADVHEDRIIVSLRDVHRDYPLGAERVHALQGVSLDVERGDYVAIVGPSGCGKSTLLNLIGVIDQRTCVGVDIVSEGVVEMGYWERRDLIHHNS